MKFGGNYVFIEIDFVLSILLFQPNKKIVKKFFVNKIEVLEANHSYNRGIPLSTATLNLCLIYFKITRALAILLEHMHK